MSNQEGGEGGGVFCHSLGFKGGCVTETDIGFEEGDKDLSEGCQRVDLLVRR